MRWLATVLFSRDGESDRTTRGDEENLYIIYMIYLHTYTIYTLYAQTQHIVYGVCFMVYKL